MVKETGWGLAKVLDDKGLRLRSFPNSLAACPMMTSLTYMLVPYNPRSLVVPPHTGRTFACRREFPCF